MTEPLENPIDEALKIAYRRGQSDEAHHLAWAIDQMVRTLTGAKYERWVKLYNGDDGDYEWKTGIAP